MVLFACVDENYGMQFNNRRQSRDRVVIEKMIELSADRRIWADPCSVDLLAAFPQTIIDKDFIQKSTNDDCCFVESIELSQYLKRFDEVVLFQWNRRYPADLLFPIVQLECDYQLIRTMDFEGNSHKCITMKVYKR